MADDIEAMREKVMAHDAKKARDEQEANDAAMKPYNDFLDSKEFKKVREEAEVLLRKHVDNEYLRTKLNALVVVTGNM